MPYKRNYSKKTYKRPGYRACGKMVYGDAKKALIMARGVKRLLNVEIKFFDTQLVSAMNNSITITQLTNIPQGDTGITRDGSQCKMLGLAFDYFIAVHASAVSTICRVMVVVDKQTNQAIYDDSDLLEDTSSVDSIVSPRNLDNKHRFTILYDKRHNLSAANATVHVKTYIKKDLLLRYDASTPSIADLTQNSLSFLMVSNESTNTPTIASFSRVRFVDN